MGAKISGASDAQDTYRAEYDLVHKDGSPAPVEINFSFLYNERGFPIGVLAITRSISERRQAERAIIDSEARYRLLAETSRDSILVLSRDDRILYLNGAAAVQFNQTAEELGGKLRSILFPLAIRAQQDENLRRVFETGQVYSEKHRHQFGERQAWLSTTLAPLHIENEQVAAVMGVSRDITERMLAQEAINYQANLVACVTDAIIATDMKFVISAWNTAAEKIYGWKAAEVLGQPMDDFIRPEYQHISRDEALLAVLETGSWQGELCHTCRDERKIPVYTTLSLIKDQEGEPSGFVAVNRDLSERVQAEEALARQAKELARSQAELEHFAHIASHDLQEPLRMVSSYIRLLSRNFVAKLGPEASEFIAFAVDGTGRMQLMLNDLLAYSRIATRGLNFDSTDCELVLEGALLTLQVSLSDARARVTHDPLPTVAAGDSQLVQVFQNLVSNAVKFRSAQPLHIHISACRMETPPGAGWLFSVSDDGIGIQPQNFERIFGIFEPLHPRSDYPGSGMGLAIWKRIIEQHGGIIWVESQPGEWATFFFTIPEQEERIHARGLKPQLSDLV